MAGFGRSSHAKRSQNNRHKGSNNAPSSTLKSKRFSLIFMGFLVFLTFFGGLVLAAWNFLQYSFIADGPAQQSQIVTVPKGAGSSVIAKKLEQQDLVKNANLFKLFVKLEKGDGQLQAGEFSIPAHASIRDIYMILKDGKAILYPFTAPEGRTSAQIYRSIDKIVTIIDDSPPLPAEGTLLPETYMMPRGVKKSELLSEMQRHQQILLDQLWPNRQKDLPIKTRQEALILASIVEKETGVSSERDLVAGVFINRLNKGMRLQSDPTIIYGLTQGEPLGRGIRRSEIDGITDWNTYQIDGLPKTPICNPGADAIRAVLNPAQTEALYFVADGTGGHVFANTLAEHNRNVAKWRKIERDKQR